MFEYLRENKQNESYSMHSMDEVYEWLDSVSKKTEVNISHISLDECDPWFYDEIGGCIRNAKGSFFKIYGAKEYEGDKLVFSQPIIDQSEIGFLGIICCKINDTWHYLMQAKIEPGNVNVVQLSPTLQATKSNFTRAHGGREPEFLQYFLNMKHEDIIVDQIQSEQGSRFLKKRNRNVIIKTEEILEEKNSHRWLTLEQIKELMHHDNVVNMDTRTVLSCIPYVLMGQEGDVPFKDKDYFYKTAWNMNRKTIVSLYNEINNYKMLAGRRTETVPLFSLDNWHMKDNVFMCDEDYPFNVIFCDIAIEGREVTRWRQPLFAATGKGLFGLICCDDDGVLKFLVKPRAEIGCFDNIEIGPTVQREPYSKEEPDVVEKLFNEKLLAKKDIIVDTILSEEGGRFYQEENRNVIISVDKNELKDLPDGYILSDYGTLNILTQVNNCLNIQLRNLLSLLEI
ncbi:MAG: NDP-hexose 2,3-dehydratase family protein [Lachnospiraceae bacterium]|nr:NDP-hexose 2,3-dehydratase family protein [Lachnospiraceae bacterium]